MTGIYLHIPFCKKKCAYCDFYSVANLSKENEFIESICKEIDYRSDGREIDTIYFGGGTPSLLKEESLSKIISSIRNNFKISSNSEITLEANPDDITKKKLNSWKALGINRLSIGVQSLDDNILEFLGRRHNSQEAINSIMLAADAGFENISADLIYGIPGLNNKKWMSSVEKLLRPEIKHLSAYHLTIEHDTLLFKKLKRNDFSIIDEEQSFQQFKALFNMTEKADIPWYEISNFAKNGFKSRHNSAYWSGKKYLGFGPSAHSFDGKKRRWNIADLNMYISNPNKFEEELLSEKDKLNDYLITHLRTRKGIDINYAEQNFSVFSKPELELKIKKYRDNGFVLKKGNSISLSLKGLFISDAILKDIIYI